MSLQQFQQALASMTLRPEFAAEVRRRGAAALDAYALAPLEIVRLVSVSRQPGMALNCTLARANRFGPIFDVYPLCCTLLMPRLRELLDRFWREHQPDNYQLSGEEDAFADFLRAGLACGNVVHPYLEEVLAYETACWELVQASRHGTAMPATAEACASFRRLRFAHDPNQLLPLLQRGETPRTDLPPRPCWLRVSLRGDALVAEIDTEADNPAHANPPHHAARWQSPALD